MCSAHKNNPFQLTYSKLISPVGKLIFFLKQCPGEQSSPVETNHAINTE